MEASKYPKRCETTTNCYRVVPDSWPNFRTHLSIVMPLPWSYGRLDGGARLSWLLTPPTQLSSGSLSRSGYLAMALMMLDDGFMMVDDGLMMVDYGYKITVIKTKNQQ